MRLWLFDTNAVSAAIHRHSEIFDARLVKEGTKGVRVSAVTYGEIRYGLESKPQATRLARNADDFFREVPILPWTETTSEVYGALRAEMRRIGKALQPLDMLIAAHAIEAGATLVSRVLHVLTEA
jgi:tRNA(fMet)-specific endonuclease VapC